jgi:phosphoribosylformylglycinamidine cyclo-ligase
MTSMNTSSGVDYIPLDEAKRLGQKIALTTAGYLPKGYKDVTWSRGESVQLVDAGSFYIGGLIEGLGTENMVADAVDAENSGNPRSYYYEIGRSNVAVVLNDAATLGVQPLQFFLKVDVCEEEWLTNRSRITRLYKGTAAACRDARCAYQGGEIPSLKGLVVPGQAILGGSTTGIVAPKSRVIRPRIQARDRIVLLRSTGLHDNGFTGARGIAAKLPDGYRSRLFSGKSFGEALLPATPIYVQAVLACVAAGIDVHYCVNITGHGWRKLMRAVKPFGYIIERIPKPHEIFTFLQEQTGFDHKQMYGSYNMGAGYALFIPPEQVKRALAILRRFFPAMDVGYVEKTNTGKYLEIRPLKIDFGREDLQVR